MVGVPDSFESDCDLIEDSDRKDYCAHVQALDFAVGSVLSSLKKYNLYDNSIIAFATDNGALSMDLCGNPGTHSAAGSAYPYRGGKYTLFEGGTRTPAFISGNLIPNDYKGTFTNTWFQAADWLPTLLHFTQSGSNVLYDDIETDNDDVNDDMTKVFNVDGYDMYSVLFQNGQNMREESNYLILNIDWSDDLNDFVDSAILYNGYKMIYNHELTLMGASCDVRSAKPFSNPFETEVNQLPSNFNYNNLLLFNLNDDPFEYIDLLNGNGKDSLDFNKYVETIEAMFSILKKEKRKGFLSQQDPTPQDAGDSTNFNGAWDSWQDETESEFEAKSRMAQRTEWMPKERLPIIKQDISLVDTGVHG